jgi:glyoxylase-like metal-dependent hydrolase (beta-lactamase superfamily II)
MKTLKIGNATVDAVVEWSGNLFDVASFWPGRSWDAIEAERDWLEPHFLLPKDKMKQGVLQASLHTYLIRTPKHNILVDTCVGNHKQRNSLPAWNMMNTDYLAKIAALGVKPEEIHYVMCTHLHFDHVGWNTKLLDGRWVPTFPNARYIFAKTEYEHWLNDKDGHAMDGSFEDSVLPVVEAGRADLVKSDFAIDDNIWLEPAPGHTPGSVCINLASGGDKALFTGDAIHHPIQIAYPDWSTAFCSDAKGSENARRNIINKICDTGTWLLAAHFMDPTVARVVGNKDRWKLKL